MSETKFNHLFREKTEGRLDLIRLESPITPGISDIACIAIRTGKFSWIEMKYLRENEDKIKFRPGQPQFARLRTANNSQAFIFVRVANSHFWLFKARPDLAWIDQITSKLSPDILDVLKPIRFPRFPDWDTVVSHFE